MTEDAVFTRIEARFPRLGGVERGKTDIMICSWDVSLERNQKPKIGLIANGPQINRQTFRG